MQVHGGVGYMREFNIERLFRDVRITNIYEGTSQLQVVAAIGKLLNHSLDPLLDEWAAIELPADVAAEQATMADLTRRLRAAIDALKAQPDRERVDYYAVDLVDAAVQVVCGWLVLRDTTVSEAKKPVARAFIAAAAPRVRSMADVVTAADPAPLEAIPVLLA
jgi:hypothetical protein